MMASELDTLRKMMRLNEGVRAKVYKDSLGIPTIGVGFNLMRLDARDRLAKLGLKYEDVLLGKVELMPDQIDFLLDEDIAECLTDLKTMFVDFARFPEPVRHVLIDLRFNLGGRGLRGFPNTLSDLRNRQYSAAADRLAKSKWASQVGKRATRNIAALKSVPDGLLLEESHVGTMEEMDDCSGCSPDGQCTGVSCRAAKA